MAAGAPVGFPRLPLETLKGLTGIAGTGGGGGSGVSGEVSAWLAPGGGNGVGEGAGSVRMPEGKAVSVGPGGWRAGTAAAAALGPGREVGTGNSGRPGAGVNGVNGVGDAGGGAVRAGRSFKTGADLYPVASAPAGSAMGAAASLAASFQMSSGCGYAVSRGGKAGRLESAARAVSGRVAPWDGLGPDSSGVGKAGRGMASKGPAAGRMAGDSAGAAAGMGSKAWKRLAKAPVVPSGESARTDAGVSSLAGPELMVSAAGAAAEATGRAGTADGADKASWEVWRRISVREPGNGIPVLEGLALAGKPAGSVSVPGSGSVLSSGA